jgi:hypothetical protein
MEGGVERLRSQTATEASLKSVIAKIASAFMRAIVAAGVPLRPGATKRGDIATVVRQIEKSLTVPRGIVMTSSRVERGHRLDSDPVSDPAADGVSYRQGMLWLSSDELAEMTRKMLGVLRESVGKRTAPGRAPYLLSPILFPTAQPPRPDGRLESRDHSRQTGAPPTSAAQGRACPR